MPWQRNINTRDGVRFLGEREEFAATRFIFSRTREQDPIKEPLPVVNRGAIMVELSWWLDKGTALWLAVCF